MHVTCMSIMSEHVLCVYIYDGCIYEKFSAM